MSDYIKREDAIKVLEGWKISPMVLDPVPSADVVEVVRCKDCKYNPYRPRPWADDDVIATYIWCEVFIHERGFCSKGKRENVADLRGAKHDRA